MRDRYGGVLQLSCCLAATGPSGGCQDGPCFDRCIISPLDVFVYSELCTAPIRQQYSPHLAAPIPLICKNNQLGREREDARYFWSPYVVPSASSPCTIFCLKILAMSSASDNLCFTSGLSGSNERLLSNLERASMRAAERIRASPARSGTC